ncbi:hypothetical protein ONZ45_g4602 [Pleurotus djamor]|nr:hypothetical protein ONZ45_g4602 [Pleurotus djamor]
MAQTVDYIVVGGGLAGLVVATRLAEDPDVSVAIIEAGKDMSQNQDIQTPALYSKSLRNPDTDWGFFTTPQDALNGRRIYLPRGKGLGGSTLLNLMQLDRASATEYDETFTPSATTVHSDTTGTSGPLPRTFPAYLTPLHTRILEAFVAVGIPFNPDPEGGSNVGSFTGPVAVHPVKHTRASSASAYYEPHKTKPNLTTLTGAQATRVVFEKNDASGDVIATAVEYQKEGEILTVSARREVILCAGAFQTPQLLELSGIGGKAILESFNIPVVVDLPGVGNNLRKPFVLPQSLVVQLHFQDHLWCPFTCELTAGLESNDVLRTPARYLEESAQYAATGTGILSAPPMSAFAFLPFSSISHDIKAPEGGVTQSVLDGTYQSPGIQQTVDLQREWLHSEEVSYVEIASVSGYLPNTRSSPIEGKNYISLLLGLLHPFSRGSVHISSANPLEVPSINPQFMTNPFDMDLLISAFKLARKIVSTESLKSAIAREVAPGPEVQFDDELAEYVRGNLQTIYHPIGTASMLPREAGGVVDESLKVYGTKNLRVVDASVMPIQISAHIQHTIYAIAEKAADIIKGRTHEGSKL